ncbi:MAG: phage shock protein A [Paenibacillus sp. RIFOXYA1_FULL_44_5]|nr:MAG: phage shock protein A [Paenibacillus sp. RIFOXYA1_FULL_44_5]
MGVFSRIKDMTKASINEMLDRAEDPVMMLNQYIRDMEEEIARAEVTTAKQVASERKLQERLQDAYRKSAEREARAAEALRGGQEELARQELEEKLYYEEKITEYSELHEQAKGQADELSRQLQEMKSDYYQMRNKRSELAARAQMAKTQKRIAEVRAVVQIEGGSASRGFQRMEEKIVQLEVEAEIAGQTHRTKQGANAGLLDQAKQRQVDEQLQALKDKLNV